MLCLHEIESLIVCYFQVAYRISFHCSLLSTQDRRKIQNLKNQADWLLHNIIPRHISTKLKQSSIYSENHKEVGIIFASLVNQYTILFLFSLVSDGQQPVMRQPNGCQQCWP